MQHLLAVAFFSSTVVAVHVVCNSKAIFCRNWELPGPGMKFKVRPCLLGAGLFTGHLESHCSSGPVKIIPFASPHVVRQP